MSGEEFRICGSCKVLKPIGDFHRRHDDKSGRARSCAACSRATGVKWRAKNPERVVETSRRWYLRNREAQRKRALMLRYGISATDFDRMMGEQNGLCKICGMINDGMALHVDHNHSSGAIRGLLCSACNTAIGLFRESRALLSAAAQYIEATG